MAKNYYDEDDEVTRKAIFTYIPSEDELYSASGIDPLFLSDLSGSEVEVIMLKDEKLIDDRELYSIYFGNAIIHDIGGNSLTLIGKEWKKHTPR